MKKIDQLLAKLQTNNIQTIFIHKESDGGLAARISINSGELVLDLGDGITLVDSELEAFCAWLHDLMTEEVGE